jgi:hypothetical protein
MPEFWTDSADGKYYLIPGNDTHLGDLDNLREVQKAEIGDASPYGTSLNQVKGFIDGKPRVKSYLRRGRKL